MEEFPIPECPICKDIYSANQTDIHAPKILKCGHTLCKKCLENIITKEEKSYCPDSECKEEIKKEKSIEDYITNKDIMKQINLIFNLNKPDDENNDESDKNNKYNVILLGNSGLGKTSIIRRLSTNIFLEYFTTTIGCDLTIYYVKYRNKKYKLTFRDPSGQERFKVVTKNFLRNVDGVLFIFDVSDEKSFLDLESWYSLYEEENEKITGLLIGNKCDLPYKVDKNECEKFAEEHGLDYMELSSKEDKNIKKAVIFLLKKIRESKLLYDSVRSSMNDYFLLQPEKKEKNEKEGKDEKDEKDGKKNKKQKQKKKKCC